MNLHATVALSWVTFNSFPLRTITCVIKYSNNAKQYKNVQLVICIKFYHSNSSIQAF